MKRVAAWTPNAVMQVIKSVAFRNDVLQDAVEESNAQSQLQVWARPLHDGSIAVALYNAGNTHATIGPPIGDRSEGTFGNIWTHMDPDRSEGI